MIGLGLSRTRPNPADSGSLAEPHPCGPSPREIIFEIGLVLALHLALAATVLLILDGRGAI